MRRIFCELFEMLAAVTVLVAGARAGDIRGDMYNLPNADPALNKTPIGAGELIGVHVFDLELNRDVPITQVGGAAFPASRVTADGFVSFPGPNYAFSVPDLPGVPRRLVRIEFRRSNPARGVILPVVTQELTQVVVESGAARSLVLDVAVPRPQPTDLSACTQPPACYSYHVRPTQLKRCLFGLLGCR
jgi:hypothetical protein